MNQFATTNLHLLIDPYQRPKKTLAHLFNINELGSKLINLELPLRKSLLHTELQGISIRAPRPELLHIEAYLCDQADD